MATTLPGGAVPRTKTPWPAAAPALESATSMAKPKARCCAAATSAAHTASKAASCSGARGLSGSEGGRGGGCSTRQASSKPSVCASAAPETSARCDSSDDACARKPSSVCSSTLGHAACAFLRAMRWSKSARSCSPAPRAQFSDRVSARAADSASRA
eukprot:scaffold126381_cov54-Phaeocystis_antarctica.AAC.1